jgi:type IV secretion system protein VirB10
MNEARAEPKLKWWVLPGAILAGVLLIGAIVCLPALLRQMPLPSITLPTPEVVPPMTTALPDTFKSTPLTYSHPATPPAPPVPHEPPKPPVAELVGRTPPPAPPPQVLLTESLLAQQAQLLDGLKGLLQRQQQPPAPATPPVPAPQPAPPPVPKEKKGWDFLAKGSGKADTAPKEDKKAEPKAADDGRGLIHNATWAIPGAPLLTIYRSQTLVGILRHAINSDIPGQVTIQLTHPVEDKFRYHTVIVPTDTLVIASQDGKPTYGQKRLTLRLEQLELPSGEVVALKATVGDQAGANGMAGNVDNHYGKLLLATGISAVLNIGVRSAAGTPGAGFYYQNPAQAAASEVGQDVQQTAKGVVDRELKVPPTITIAAGTACTIQLGENVQFSHHPVVVR